VPTTLKLLDFNVVMVGTARKSALPTLQITSSRHLFTAPPLSFVLQRLPHFLEFLQRAAVDFGKRSSSLSSALTMVDPITTRGEPFVVRPAHMPWRRAVEVWRIRS